MSLLNDVITIVSLDGTPVKYTDVVLSQGFNRHHTFTITLHYEAVEPFWMSRPKQVFSYVGKEVQISFQHRVTGVRNLFVGIVSKVTYAGKNGINNTIILHGGSPTLKLDGNPTMDSFTDKTLKMIVNAAVGHSGNGAEVVAKPKFDEKIDYLCQYGESCFGFLDRLSRVYGEWFYYDGRQIRFGKPDSLETVELVYDVHVRKMELSVQAVPHTVGMYEYLRQNGERFDAHVKPDDQETGGYAQLALTRSGEFFPSEGIVPSPVPVAAQRELLNPVTNFGRRSAISEMLVMDGESVDCRVWIGKIVEISLPQTMNVDIRSTGEFLIGEITHRADMGGRYSNTFKGYTKYAECVPLEPISFPMAGPQLAVVTDNADPEGKGRVKVKFQWQQDGNKSTNWIRVQTPDGGSSAKGTRGFTFVPEKEDQVIVGFEYGSPDRPYVTGSVFSKDVGQGGGEGNKSKSLVSRSGSAVKLDDEKGTVTITDQTGNNLIVIDGNDTITITSTKNIRLTNGKSFICIEEDNISISAKNVGIDGEETIILKSKDEILGVVAGEGVTGSGTNIVLSGKSVMELTAENLSVAGKEVSVNGSATNVIEGGIVKINS